MSNMERCGCESCYCGRITALDRDRLAQAIQDHVDEEYGDEGYNHETSEVTYFDHKCSNYCAADIIRRYDEDPQ